MPQIITGTVLYRNGIDLTSANRVEPINCQDVTVLGTAWIYPNYQSGIFNGHLFSLRAEKPTVDSMKAVHIRINSTQDSIYVSIPDGGTVANFIDICDTCCEGDNTITAGAIPTRIAEDYPCADENGNYTFNFAVPANTIPLSYNATAGASFNGAYITPATSGVLISTVDTPAELLAAFQTNYGAYGTWSLQNSNKTLRLVSTTTQSAGVALGLTPASYCLPIPSTPTLVDNVQVGGVTIPFCPTLMTRANPEALRQVLASMIPGVWVVSVSSGQASLQYTGLVQPQTVKLVTTTKGTFASGVCVA